MEPEMNSDQYQPPIEPHEPIETPQVAEFQPPVSDQKTKEPISKWVVLLAIVAAVIALAVAGYFAYNAFKPAPQAANVQNSPTETIQASNPNLKAAAVTMITIATDEQILTNIDDNNTASDASSAAGNVGDSINENNFQ